MLASSLFLLFLKLYDFPCEPSVPIWNAAEGLRTETVCKHCLCFGGKMCCECVCTHVCMLMHV